MIVKNFFNLDNNKKIDRKIFNICRVLKQEKKNYHSHAANIVNLRYRCGM